MTELARTVAQQGRLAVQGRGDEQDAARAVSLGQRDDGVVRNVDIPGNADIEPILNEEMLCVEGLTMHHCVASYAEAVRNRRRYIYKVLKPARATLELIADRKGWTVGQIKGYCNADVGSDVIEAVRDWLSSAEGAENVAAERKKPLKEHAE